MTNSKMPVGYDTPVRQLLEIGEPRLDSPEKWPDYLTQFELTGDHVVELTRMACDPLLHEGDPDRAWVWAPVHAWRALGQLRAEAAAAPLLAFLETADDHHADSELPAVFGMIGPSAIPHLVAFIARPGLDIYIAATAMDGLSEIGHRHPDARAECVRLLTSMLEKHANQEPELNGFIISDLIHLAAVESIDTIREAYQDNDVELSFAGDLEDVEIDLGLRTSRSTPKPRYLDLFPRGFDWASGKFPSHEIQTPIVSNKVGRNEACPCGSGKKYKRCCLREAS